VQTIRDAIEENEGVRMPRIVTKATAGLVA
jgi:hypothetical protein